VTVPLRVALVGLGPIGLEVGRALRGRVDARLVAAGDVAPAVAGAPLSAQLPEAPGDVVVDAELGAALARGVDAVALCTSSRLAAVVRDLETAIEGGAHVASTCEELAAPRVDPARWAELDARARARGVTVVGTGVNPGFVMDRLVLQLAGAAVRVDGVQVERVVDAAKRRGPLRRKVGEGLSETQFREGAAAGRIGHVGLGESAALIARGLGWRMDRYVEHIEPVVAVDGRCRGLRQEGRATVAGEEKIRLSLAMYVGAPDPHDHILLQGDPPLDVRIAGGVQGDRGTVGTMVNALMRLVRAPRGLVTVADVFA
jgi:4-hydroxy-tetrahydrodipicolinate reductase